MALSDLTRGNDTAYLLSDFLPSGADPTLYTAFLSVCEIATPGTNLIVGATNTSPIVINAIAHGLTTGDKVVVVNVGGVDAARGVWTVTVVDADHFSLNSSVGSGTFTRGGEWYKAVPDAAGISFSGSPPTATVLGSLGFQQNKGYLLIMTCTGTYRDKVNAFFYTSAIDNAV